MRYSYAILSLIVLSCWNVTICSAQSKNIDTIITPSSLKAVVEALAADSFQGRLTGTLQAAKAAELISQQFKDAGALPIAGTEGYLMSFEISYKVTAFNFNLPYKSKSLNVVAALPGHSKAKELVIFSAHYDHAGTKTYGIRSSSTLPENGQPEVGDEIYNGANDNASGVSGLIHLARYYAKHPHNERTIIFIAFSGEEEGCLGSRHLSEGFDPKVVTAVINMDMIGRPVSSKNKHPYITGEERSDLQSILNKRLHEADREYGKKYFQGDRYPEEKLFSRSDNFPFAQKGMVAHTIMTSAPDDKYYHSLNDECDKLDYPFMAEIVKAIALATTGLVDGSDAPKKN
jgi:Zn-dependent M28 family amino/carboxypeptidase